MADLHPSDFSGATPRRTDLRTPNPLATPLRAHGGVPATPGGMTPGMTPRAGGQFTLPSTRDNLNINESASEYADGTVADDFMAEEEQQAAV